MVKVDIKIMGCHKRDEYIKAMLEKLGLDESIVCYDDRDGKGDAMYTARKAWLAPIPYGVTHRLVLQDDCLLCNDFVDIVHKIVEQYPNVFFSLLNTRVNPEDKKIDSPYIQIVGERMYGQAIIMPVKHIQKMFDWIDRLEKGYRHDDTAIGTYASVNGIKVLSTIPSLLQHLCPTDSLLGYNNEKKVSRVWIGEDLSHIDWTKRGLNKSIYMVNLLGLKDKYKDDFVKEQIRERKRRERERARKRGKEMANKIKTFDGYKYNGAIDRVNVKPDKRYNVNDSLGIMQVHDLFDEIPSYFYNADYVIVDPPYNNQALKSYYRKAELELNNDIDELLNRIFEVMKEIKVNACYMEVGCKYVEAIKPRMEKAFDNVRVIDSFYYGNKPCAFVIGENNGHSIELEAEPKDELKVIDEIISKKDGTVLDFCLGRGAVSRTAYKYGKPFIGTELNINRLAVSIEDLIKKGATIEEVAE